MCNEGPPHTHIARRFSDDAESIMDRLYYNGPPKVYSGEDAASYDARALADDLLAMQDGSYEDAIALLDSNDPAQAKVIELLRQRAIDTE